MTYSNTSHKIKETTTHSSTPLDSSEEYDTFFVYVAPSLCFVGILFEIISIGVFSHKSFNKQFIFQYLKVKFIFEMLDLWIGLLRPISDCRPTSDTYMGRVFFIMTVVYFASVCEQSAVICQIVSSFYFYVLISNKQKRNNDGSYLTHILKLFDNFKVICFFILLFGILLFSYQLFQYTVEPVIVIDFESNSTLFVYRQKNRAFNSQIEKPF